VYVLGDRWGVPEIIGIPPVAQHAICGVFQNAIAIPVGGSVVVETVGNVERRGLCLRAVILLYVEAGIAVPIEVVILLPVAVVALDVLDVA
jgi:hypothetical protein